ncbi:putative sporulation protein YtxC [Lucifera butyrica]|uniref:putative sporulation protein YtxC n=1 Tax=Lucifera butyrica TaxID=1351585 RepID=UPI000F020FAF|nr:putative sporulation protein YtxC [Lucifera butyrica]
MKLLTVGVIGATDELKEKLQQDCYTLAQDGFRVGIDEINKGNYTFLGCNINEGEMSFRNYERIKGLIKNYAAKMLAELIVRQEEKNLVRKAIERNYYYFSEEEKNVIYGNAISLLNNGGNETDEFNFLSRCSMIEAKISEYLDTHHELVVEGFINFRLKDYREKLSKVVDTAVDDFMMDAEYKEFIRVLRYFVDVQEPLIEEVHVVIIDGNSFKILDAQGKAIQNQYLDSMLVAQTTEEINYEDSVISALITIAPYTIMVHGNNLAKAQEVVETIKNVFDGRVVVCGGCDLCQENKLFDN